MREPTPLVEPRPLGELFSELATETGVLVKKEVELAKSEMTSNLKTMAKDAVVIGVGLVFALAGALAMLAAVILILALVLPLWLAALIVAVGSLGIGAALAIGGAVALKNTDPTPRQTIATLKENKQWLIEQAHR